MNHLRALAKTAYAALDTPLLIVEGAYTLSLLDNAIWHNASCDEDVLSITKSNGRFVLNLHKSPNAPLVIHCAPSTALSLLVADKSSAHIVVIGNHNASLAIDCAPTTDCSLYFMPSELQSVTLTARVQKNARLKLFDMGGGVQHCARDITIHLIGEKAQVDYCGLDQLHGVQQKQSHLVVKHEACETKSTQIFRGIYSGDAYGSFLGQVVIEKNAVNASAQQLYKAIILGDKAKAHVKPELVIYNHDISASHGASIGELDDEALFYLCSRGIPIIEAQALLIESIVESVLSAIDIPTLKQALIKESAHATKRLIGASL